jgi:hypothetical protein
MRLTSSALTDIVIPPRLTYMSPVKSCGVDLTRTVGVGVAGGTEAEAGKDASMRLGLAVPAAETVGVAV